ncbi:MAG TPA: SUF system NifU family Fe-S cluster assembly protein [Gemmatimonadaceae bacterium]|nr:SUF system NifU family Fe-S cluster assembly protein [Gemmatimonadaceae bacterium]
MSDRAATEAVYQELLLDHYRRPRNRGPLPDADVTVEQRNPLCGDILTLQLDLEEGRVREAAFTGQGCAISQAAASMMTQQLRGKTIDEALALRERFRAMILGDAEAARDTSLGDLRALSGVARLPVRVKCALLAFSALEEALKGRDARRATRDAADEDGLEP